MTRPRPGKHIEGQVVNAIQIAGENGPALTSELKIAPLNREFNGPSTALQALQNILDGVAHNGDCLAHCSETIALTNASSFIDGLQKPHGELRNALAPRFWRLAKVHDNPALPIAKRNRNPNRVLARGSFNRDCIGLNRSGKRRTERGQLQRVRLLLARSDRPQHG